MYQEQYHLPIKKLQRSMKIFGFAGSSADSMSHTRRIMKVRGLQLSKYKNIVDVLQVTSRVRKIFGIAIYELITDKKNRAVSQFSWSGCIFLFIWLVMYYFCAYKAFYEDQTILRTFYNTRLRHYGDVYEKIVSIALLTLTLWHMVIRLNVSPDYMQKLLDIDSSIKNLSIKIDYRRDAWSLLAACLIQILAGTARLLSICIPLYYLEISLPIDWIVQAAVTNIYALVVTSHYCNYVRFLISRYKIVNTVLTKIKVQKCSQRRVLVHAGTRSALESMEKDKYVCEKIKACAKTCGLIFAAVESSQIMYGFLLVCALLFCTLYLVLYLFYFMEATAGGLFHDSQRYAFFLLNIFWQILYAVGVIILNIYISESAVEQAKKTSYIVHEIINSDMSPQITAEALQLSKQLLHQIPVFTACGLTKIDYPLFLKGTSSVTTFLVILLQFVMD